MPILGSGLKKMGGLGSSSLLPINIDFTALADGALPATLVGSTWAIVSGAAVNTPTLGAERITDGGLEAAYSSGRCTTLTVNGSPTLADETSDVHGGSHAQRLTAVAFNDRANFPTVAGVQYQWFQFLIWTKRQSGTSGTTAARVFQSGALPVNSIDMAINDAAYTLKKAALLSTSTNAIFAYAAVETGSGSHDTVVSDDGSHKNITYSSLFAGTLTPRPSDIVVKIQPANGALPDWCPAGFWAWGNASTSPTSFIVAEMWPHQSIPTAINTVVKKYVNGVPSVVQGSTGITKVNGAYFELRRDPIDNTKFKLYYNNAQVGSDMVISDAEIMSNGYHGLFSSGGFRIDRFFSTAS